jgi:hypothetical protein
MPEQRQGCDELSDSDFYEAFEGGRVSKDVFRHAEHVRLGFIYLLRHPDFGEGAMRFRRAFQRFVRAQGVEHVYNETLTWAYLVLIHQRMHERPAADSFEFIRDSPDLCDHRHGLVSRYYDLEQIVKSPTAKAMFVLPSR